MNAEDLYNEIKGVLDYFDLRWNEKHLVQVQFSQDVVLFTYKDRHVKICTNYERK